MVTLLLTLNSTDCNIICSITIKYIKYKYNQIYQMYINTCIKYGNAVVNFK